MELIVISADKLKIMLSDTDMKKYEIDADSLEYDTAETRRAFRHILADAKVKTGFDVGKDRILVQMYPCRRGGCEMFVTKLDEQEMCTGRRAERGFGAAKPRLLPAGMAGLPTLAFSFDSLGDLIACCRRLSRAGWRGTSTAFRIDDGRLALLLCGDVGSSSPLSLGTLLADYGKRENPDTYRGYVGEHGDVLCPKEAVPTLGRL